MIKKICFYICRGCWAISRRDIKQAYACQVVAIQAFVKAFQMQKDENW